MPSEKDIHFEADPVLKIITVSGNTYDSRNILKKHGGKWDKGTGRWKIPFESEDQYNMIAKEVKNFLKEKRKEEGGFIAWKRTTEVIKYKIGEEKPSYRDEYN